MITTFERDLEYLRWNIPSAYGVKIPCDMNCRSNTCRSCSKCWCRQDRERFYQSRKYALEIIEQETGSLCDDVQRSKIVKIDLNNCVLKLESGLAYLGKTEKIIIGEYPITYITGDCAEDFEGYIDIPDIDFVCIGTESESVKFEYNKVYCNIYQQLSDTYCEDLDETTNTHRYTWKKWQLAKPETNCIDLEAEYGYIDTIVAYYNCVIPNSAIEPIKECECSGCKSGSCVNQDYTYEINDAELGEVCILNKVGCCAVSSWVRVWYGVKPKDIPVEIQDTIALLAMIRMDKMYADCIQCDGFETGDWLEKSSVFDPAVDNFQQLKYGNTNAAIEVQRILKRFIDSKNKRTDNSELKLRYSTRKDFRALWK